MSAAEGVSVDCGCGPEDVCSKHLARFRRQLGEVPTLLAELGRTAAKLDRGGAQVGGTGKGKPAPLPFNPEAVVVRDQLGEGLLTWARDLHPAWVVREGTPSVVAWCVAASYLRQQAAVVAARPGGPGFARWLDGQMATGWRMIDGHRRDRWFAGVCGAVRSGVAFLEDAGRPGVLVPEFAERAERCPELLFASTAAASVDCRRCGASYPVAERRAELVRFAEGFEMPLRTITSALPWLAGLDVKPATVRGWTRQQMAKRRVFVAGPSVVYRPHRPRLPAQLQPASWSEGGEALYLVGAVIELALATAKRATARAAA